MTQVLSDNLLCLFYLLLWVLTLAWYQYKNHTIDAGTAIISTYVLYAIFSIITLNDDFFSVAYNPLKLFPFIYLYVMLMIALAPTIYHHLNPPKSIIEPHSKILVITAILTIVMAATRIPEIISDFSNGIKLFTDVEGGNDAYMEQIEKTTEQGKSISNLFAIIDNTLSDLPVFLFFYFLTLKKKNYWILGGLLFAISNCVVLPVLHGQRGSVIISVLTIIVGYALFKPFISKRINRIFKIFGLTSMIIISLPIIAITMSRFGENVVGAGGIVNWYVGQGNLYFNNYGLDAGGIRNGDRTMFLIKMAVNPEDTPKNYFERREKYHQLKIDDYWFYTFVGDFTIDFGPFYAFVIFVVFNFIILLLTRPRDGTIKVYQMLLLYFTMCICMQGGMTLYSYADYNGLRIIVLLMLYTYLRYHELLLEKFPLVQSSENDDSLEDVDKDK